MAIRAETLLLAALATRHLNVQPMAIGRIPPSFLLRPSKVAPKKDDLMSACTVPDKIKLTKDVRACKSCWSPSLADILVISTKCCRRRQSGPPADPLGKDSKALKTSD